MRRFIIRFLSVVVIVLACLFVICFLFPNDKNAYLLEFSKKMTLIEKTKSPRIIFIGGSNAAFGLDSRRIQDSLNMNVVNMGLHAGLGIRYTLAQCLPYIRKGDIVVMDVEYSNFFGKGAEGQSDTFAKLMVLDNFRGYSSLTTTQKLGVLIGLSDVAQKNIKRMMRYPKYKTFDSYSPKSGETYNYCMSGFNEYGDEISHWKLRSDIVPNLYVSDPHWSYNNDFGNWYFAKLRDISRKATVVVIPPAFAKTTFMCEKSYIDQLESIYKKECFPYAVSPVSMTIPDNYMYNTYYHCSKKGVDLNTGRIIRILKDLNLSKNPSWNSSK